MKNRNVISGKQRLVSGIKEEEGVRERLALVHTKPLDVFHVSLPELAMVPIEEMKREERPKVELLDTYKVQEVLNECEKQAEQLLLQRRCGGSNTLQSTADEDFPAVVVPVSNLVQNIIGAKKGLNTDVTLPQRKFKMV
jgi:hypothetical protein